MEKVLEITLPMYSGYILIARHHPTVLIYFSRSISTSFRLLISTKLVMNTNAKVQLAPGIWDSCAVLRKKHLYTIFYDYGVSNRETKIFIQCLFILLVNIFSVYICYFIFVRKIRSLEEVNNRLFRLRQVNFM